MHTKQVEYHSLKLISTKYPLCKKKIVKLYDDTLLESVSSYMLLTRAYDDEMLHILFSRKIVAKYASYLLLFLSVIFAIYAMIVPGLICLAISALSFFGSRYFEKKFQEYYQSTLLTSMVLDYQSLTELRETLLEEQEKNMLKQTEIE